MMITNLIQTTSSMMFNYAKITKIKRCKEEIIFRNYSVNKKIE